MDRVKMALKKNIHEEKEAIKGYRADAKKARKMGNKPVANRFSEIAKDETHHLKELKQLQKKTK